MDEKTSDRKDLIVCRCEEITAAEIEKAIKNGASNLNEIKRVTRAGMGLCQGRSCGQHLQKIATQQGLDNSLLFLSERPPVRLVKISYLKEEDSDFTDLGTGVNDNER